MFFPLKKISLPVISSYVQRFSDDLPDRVKSLVGATKIIEEDVKHLTSLKFTPDNYLVLSYLDGVQVLRLNLQLTSFEEIYSQTIDDGVMTAAVLVKAPIAKTLLQGSAGSAAAAASAATHHIISTSAPCAPLCMYVPLSNLSEVRFLDATCANNAFGTIHRVELVAPITDLVVIAHKGQAILVVSSHRHLRLFDLYQYSPLATIAIAPSAVSPALAFSGSTLWYESAELPTRLTAFDWSAQRVLIRKHLGSDTWNQRHPRTQWNQWTQWSGERGDVNANNQLAGSSDVWLDCGESENNAAPRDLPIPTWEPNDEGENDGLVAQKESIRAIALYEDTVAVCYREGKELSIFRWSESNTGKSDLIELAKSDVPPMCTILPPLISPDRWADWNVTTMALTQRFVVLATVYGACWIFSIQGRITPLRLFHLGAPLTQEIFQPQLKLIGNPSTHMLIASLSGAMHVACLELWLQTGGYKEPSSSVRFSLPANLSKIGGESIRFCRQRHFHRARVWKREELKDDEPSGYTSSSSSISPRKERKKIIGN